jgi:hypothetical protein
MGLFPASPACHGNLIAWSTTGHWHILIDMLYGSHLNSKIEKHALNIPGKFSKKT